MAPVVSILTATYNRAHFLSEAIESVLSQDFANFELMIGDNASTDDTNEVVRRYAREDSRIKYFRNSANLGSTTNFNLCYRRSDPSSKYYIFLPSDDWWEPTFLSKLVAAGDECPSATIIHSDSYRTNAAGQIINKYSDLWKKLPPPGQHAAVRELYEGCYINANSALVNRKMQEHLYPVEDIFTPDLTFTPDYDLWLQLLTRGASAYYVPEPLVYFRKHEGAMTMPANLVSRLREEVRIFGERLPGVCPSELDQARREALVNRLIALGFALLDAGDVDGARRPLREARQAYKLSSRRRLDLPIAAAISSLPVPIGPRVALWHLAIASARALGRRQ